MVMERLGSIVRLQESTVTREAKRMKVLIADDRARVRYALKVLLDRQSDVQVVGEVFHASSLSAQVEATRPDILLLDWGLPGLGKPASIDAIRRDHPGLKVIVLSGQPDVGKQAMLAGADGFVNKTETPDQLLTVIHSCGCA